MQDRAKLLAYLKALGLADQLGTFSGRIRAQKLFYLLKQYDKEIQFGYSWYIHGPYSPQLTRTIFNEEKVAVGELGKNEMEYVNEIRNFLNEDLYSPDALELIVSLIYVARNGDAPELGTRRGIVDFILEQKPQFSRDQVEAALERVLASPKFGKMLPAN
jgi:uncharacterized protein YwgA